MLPLVLYVAVGISTFKNYYIVSYLIIWIHCLIAWIDHIVFMHSLVPGYLGCCLAIMMNAPLNICIEVFA